MNITIRNVTFSYPSGVVALRNVSLALRSGEAVALIGENGAGKTTLAKHFNGLLKPNEGQVLVGNWDTREHTVAQLAARVGYVFQNPDDQLFAQRVWDDVAFGPRNLGVNEAELKTRVSTTLKSVGLAAKEQAHPYDLSQAERRLVSLAAVLAMQTPVVLLDEPTTALDRHGTQQIGEIIKTLQAEGRTILTITHDMDFCADHFERVIVMADGEVRADGPTAEILSQEDLLDEAGVEPPQVVRLALALGLPDIPLSIESFLKSYAQWQEKQEQKE